MVSSGTQLSSSWLRPNTRITRARSKRTKDCACAVPTMVAKVFTCTLVCFSESLAAPRPSCDSHAMRVSVRPADFRASSFALSAESPLVSSSFPARRKPRQRQQSIIRRREKIESRPPCMRPSLRYRHKHRRVARRMNRNIGRESRSAAGLLNDVPHVFAGSQVHPSQSNSIRPTSMVQSVLLAFEACPATDTLWSHRLSAPVSPLPPGT